MTPLEVKFMRRKLNELKKATTPHSKEKAARSLETALAKAMRDEEMARVIADAIGERKPDHVMRDVALLTQIVSRLDRSCDERDTEILLVMA